jgi:hypothetical protein
MLLSSKEYFSKIGDVLQMSSCSYYKNSLHTILHCATSRTVSGSIPGDVTGDFFRATNRIMCPGVDSASKNEYQGFILR